MVAMPCYGWGVKQDSNEPPAPGRTEREQWVKRYRASGQTAKEFAQRHGLKPGQLHYWVYQSPPAPRSPAVVPTFREVRLPAAALTAGSWVAEIGLPDGTTVRLARPMDLGWSLALLNGLRGPCSPP